MLKEKPIEEINAYVFEENGMRELKVFTLGGSGSPIFSYPLAENEECAYRVNSDASTITVDVTINTIE